ncbi:restriction endonuclease [Streptacidiphilus sp. EB103A]|uniref:restriction endonuclease n=1 Tax=Streptacidiphilus sp. EB103A TaxID=3156275 RepID=UPI0035124F8D
MRGERGTVLDEDGDLDPTLKFILVALLVVAAAVMAWKFLLSPVVHWFAVDVPHWFTATVPAWSAGHPWTTALIAVGVLLLAVLVVRARLHAGYGYAGYAQAEDEMGAEDLGLTFRMREFVAMTGTEFELAVAQLLARDGFLSASHVGGAGDLGQDVRAWDTQGRKLVLQCKRYTKAVGSEHVQRFNGTARAVHGADLPLIVALNGFSIHAANFAASQGIILVGRSELKRWAHGEHLYNVLAPNNPALGLA